MLNNINRSIEIFESNFRAAKSAYVLNTSLEASACAAAFIGRNFVVSPERLRDAKKVVRSNTGIFSTLGHGNASQVIAATVSMSEEPQVAMDTIRFIHSALDEKFFNSDYLVLAANMIYSNADPADYSRIVSRTREIYKLIRRDHPMITGREDLSNCVLMALSDYSETQIARRCEDDFRALHDYYRLKNRIQYMACITSIFDGRPEDKALRVVSTQKALKQVGLRFSGDAFSVIASIAMLVREEDLQEVASMIHETSKKLRKIRGMGAMGAGKRIRDLIACALVIESYTDAGNSAVRDSAISTIISAIIAVEIAIIASSAAAASAAAASSS
ncbi:MAG: DUF4003 family protein [Clostridiales bacterium]|nr:DUF4003 family protein [Clostridiales bacterium]